MDGRLSLLHKLASIAKTIVISVVVFLVPLKAIISSVLVLVLMDMGFGVYAAHKSGQAIESNKLKRTVSKLLLYYSAILVGYIAGNWLITAFIPVESMITTLIGVVEVKSILENLDTISGGDFFKTILDKLNRPNDN